MNWHDARKELPRERISDDEWLTQIILKLHRKSEIVKNYYLYEIVVFTDEFCIGDEKPAFYTDFSGMFKNAKAISPDDDQYDEMYWEYLPNVLSELKEEHGDMSKEGEL